MANEKIRELVDAALAGNYERSNQLLNQEMANRANSYLEQAKQNEAKHFFESEDKKLNLGSHSKSPEKDLNKDGSGEHTSPSNSRKTNKEIIVHGMKDNEDTFKKNYGPDAKTVMYATANKMAKKVSE